MKKIFAMLLTLSMLLSFVACVETPQINESGSAFETDTPENSGDGVGSESSSDMDETDEKITETSESTTNNNDDSEDTETNNGSEDDSEEDSDTSSVDTPDVETVRKYPYTDRDGVIHISFQDTFELGANVIAVNTIDTTSYKTGTDEKDEAVLTAKGTAVYASGCGLASAILENGSVEYFMVHPSPINLLFLTGQSNGAGDPPSTSTFEAGEYQKYFISSPETMAYYVFTNQVLTIDNANTYVPSNLVWDTCFTNRNGCDPKVLTEENYTGNFKNFSICAGLAYQWIEETGERVWIVNASHGGQPIHCFQPSKDGSIADNDYYQATTVFNLALETLYREVDAGHFTLNHMAYYWYQGEGDSNDTYENYLDAFTNMHTGMMNDVVYKHNGVVKKLEYCGIMTVRSCKDNSGNSLDELYITGPRLAQYIAANDQDGVLSNVFLASKVTERWTGSDKNVENYFLEVYGSEQNFKSIFGYDMPKTLATLKPEIHYRIFGQNEKGMDAARNSLQFLNYLYPDRQYELSFDNSTEKPELTLVSRDGYTPVTDVLEINASTMEGYLIPYITPVWRTVEGLSLRPVTAGVTAEGFVVTIVDKTLKEFTIDIYLGDNLLDTYTLKIKYRSQFEDNKPLYINFGTSKYPDRGFGGFVGGWDVGLISFADGSFTVYDQLAIVDDVRYLTAGIQEGFRLDQMTFFLEPSKAEGSLAIRFKAGKDGIVKLGATLFSPNREACYVAVFVNGEKVAPDNDKVASDKTGWTLFNSSSNASALNANWADVLLDIKEGDEIVFALSSKSVAPNASLYPTVEYVD